MAVYLRIALTISEYGEISTRELDVCERTKNLPSGTCLVLLTNRQYEELKRNINTLNWKINNVNLLKGNINATENKNAREELVEKHYEEMREQCDKIIGFYIDNLRKLISEYRR